jgi:putative membrane protein
VDVVTLANAGGPGGWWWPFFPLLWFALFWGALFFFGFRFRRNWARREGGGSAEAVLGERYARGEISVQEYRERLSVLQERAR